METLPTLWQSMAIYGNLWYQKKQKLGKLILEDQGASKSFQEIRPVTVTGCREQGTGIGPWNQTLFCDKESEALPLRSPQFLEG